MGRNRIQTLQAQIKSQKQWIDRCGGNLTGYIEHYGDPGMPPLEDGQPKTFLIPADKADIVRDHLEKVSGYIGPDILVYARHYGNGGTAIYDADIQRLASLEADLYWILQRIPLRDRKPIELSAADRLSAENRRLQKENERLRVENEQLRQD